MKKLEFPLLNANDIEVRVQNVKTGSGFSLLLYKTARTDAKYLDQVVGAFNWQDKYYLLNDTLYCSIGIYCEERSEWVWKDDCGSETQVEKEKKKDLLTTPAWSLKQLMEYLGIKSRSTGIRLKARAFKEFDGAIPYGS